MDDILGGQLDVLFDVFYGMNQKNESLIFKKEKKHFFIIL